MIATHTPKLLVARIRSNALSTAIDGDIPDHFICSKTVEMRRRFWACPRDLAKMKLWRASVSDFSESYMPLKSIPDIKDGHIKQLLLPNDWRNDDYVSVTPVASCGVIHEMFMRLYESRLPYKKHIVQPTIAARTAHGEMLLHQSGRLRLMRRGVINLTNDENWRGDFVQLTARCEGMNISSGMLSLGFPALTAIGGFVHTLERKTGQDINFALGICSSHWKEGSPKITVHVGSPYASTGRVKGKKVAIRPGFSREEITATCEIVLLLKTDHPLIPDLLNKVHRLSGGSLFDAKVSVIKNGMPPRANYLSDASQEISRLQKKTRQDSLSAALSKFAEHGKWVNKKWRQRGNGHTLNHTGYAFLEKPTQRENIRGNYSHAWAEPIFSLITQGVMSDDCWWSRKEMASGVFWGKSTSN